MRNVIFIISMSLILLCSGGCQQLSGQLPATATNSSPQVLDSYEATVPINLDTVAIRPIFKTQEYLSSSGDKDTQLTIEPTKIDSQNKAIILSQLTHSDVLINSYVVEADGKLTVLTSQVSGKGKHVMVQRDYINYRTFEKDGKEQKLGILLRVETDFVVLNGNINISLFAAALAAESGSARGTMKVQVWGLSGAPINTLIPLPNTLSEESVINALSAVAVIKTKIYDEGVLVVPCLLP
jgi:hypothetical protein